MIRYCRHNGDPTGIDKPFAITSPRLGTWACATDGVWVVAARHRGDLPLAHAPVGSACEEIITAALALDRADTVQRIRSVAALAGLALA